MDIKNITSIPSGIPTKEKQPKDPYDLDLRIQQLVNEKERSPNREDAGTFTCSRCGSCGGTCAV